MQVLLALSMEALLVYSDLPTPEYTPFHGVSIGLLAGPLSGVSSSLPLPVNIVLRQA